ncbi:MAG TPA: ATP-binding protein [Pyrinomonadaceae bacterium]|nr:ATP-binding protein [Pyrinomonadaceae bacterium]
MNFELLESVMPEDEKKEDGRVVYSRRAEAEGDGFASALAEGAGEFASALMHDSLWRTLLPLFVGFALLVGLVFGLGYRSAGELEDVRFSTQREERRLGETQSYLLNLRLELSRLDTEARIRGRIEAGTQGVMLPPTDLRLRNERDAVVKLLPEFDTLPLRDAEAKQRARQLLDKYVADTTDLRSYSLGGYADFRDLDELLRSLMKGVDDERYTIEGQRDEALRQAQRKLRLLMWLAAVTALVVAAVTFLEVWRRFRQMRRNFAALRRERQFSAQMLEGLPSAVAAIDQRDRIRSANVAFFDVFPGASVGASIHDKFTTPEGLKLLASATSTRVERTVYRGRFRLAGDGGGRDRAFDVYSSPLEIEGERGQLLTLVDVTEAAEAEQELRRGEALAAVGQAAAQVAHEIKNPLGSIRLGVAMLRDMTRDREAINTIDLVERGIEHLSKLTLDVTQFSRRSKLALADVDLNDLLVESLDLVAEKISEKRTPVEKNFTTEPVRGHWDEDQLRQVFVNLIANAVDAGPAESIVNISTERTTVAIGIGRNGEGGKQVAGARVRIEDRGQGMNEETRARIFEPFFTTKKKGTGLGLAIAKQIVEQHDGTIRVESRPNEGTRFTVELPLSPDAA